MFGFHQVALKTKNPEKLNTRRRIPLKAKRGRHSLLLKMVGLV